MVPSQQMHRDIATFAPVQQHLSPNQVTRHSDGELCSFLPNTSYLEVASYLSLDIALLALEQILGVGLPQEDPELPLGEFQAQWLADLGATSCSCSSSRRVIFPLSAFPWGQALDPVLQEASLVLQPT